MSNLILRRTLEAGFELPAPRFAAHVTWELMRSGITYRSGTMKNLIVNGGLDGMATGRFDQLAAWVQVGTGSSTPTASQTALDAPVAPRVNRTTVGNGVTASGPDFEYWSHKLVKLFIEAEANGNLTEVAFFNLETAGTMFSRQLFKDLLGVPTTVVKTSDDQLKITYEVRLYPPEDDIVQSGIVISGESYDVTTRVREIDQSIIWGWNGSNGLLVGMGSDAFGGFAGGRAFEASTTLGNREGSLSGANASADTSIAAGYSSGNFYRDVTMKWEPTTGNLTGGIGGFHSYGGSTREIFQSKVTPAFPKDAVKRLTLVVRNSWARYP